MGTTPNYGLPYPELTDTADVPRDVKALADRIDLVFGGGGSGGGETLNFAPVLDVGLPGQLRAGRQLTPADFTNLGLTAPLGLWNLSGLTDASGNGRNLTDKGSVPYGTGINGLASTAAVFAGSTAQALYIADTGTSDPFRIRTGSWGCWFRTAKRGTQAYPMTKASTTAGQYGWFMSINTSNIVGAQVSTTGSDVPGVSGVSDVCDDRWHQVIATADGTALRLYVDGVLEGVGTAGPIFGSTAPLNIGGWGADGATAATNPHYGRVDEAFVTDQVLSDDQVRNLYCCSVLHTLAAVPNRVVLNVKRGRRGAPLAVADFPTQPIRLHNFTAAALTDQGSGNITLSNTGGALSVAGADGTPNGAYNFVAASSQSLAATDAGLPAGTAARSYGCWLKTTTTAAVGVMGWGTQAAAHVALALWNGQYIYAANGADNINGVFVMDGQWHLAVVTEDNAAGDGVRRKLYVDGRLVGGSTVLNSITGGGAGKFRVGCFPDATSPFTGQIDGVFVCGYALTAPQVAALYAKSTAGLAQSPKNSGDHVEASEASRLLATFDTLASVDQINLGVSQ